MAYVSYKINFGDKRTIRLEYDPDQDNTDIFVTDRCHQTVLISGLSNDDLVLIGDTIDNYLWNLNRE